MSRPQRISWRMRYSWNRRVCHSCEILIRRQLALVCPTHSTISLTPMPLFNTLQRISSTQLDVYQVPTPARLDGGDGRRDFPHVLVQRGKSIRALYPYRYHWYREAVRLFQKLRPSACSCLTRHLLNTSNHTSILLLIIPLFHLFSSLSSPFSRRLRRLIDIRRPVDSRRFPPDLRHLPSSRRRLAVVSPSSPCGGRRRATAPGWPPTRRASPCSPPPSPPPSPPTRPPSSAT